MRIQLKFMKEVATVLFVSLALLLGGCGTDQTHAQEQASGVW
jgi:hypothetical protein